MRAGPTLALGAGAALYALALPPFDCWPLAWVALVPLLLATRAARPRTALALGALAGFLTSWTVTWWLVQAISSYFAANILVGAAATCAAYGLAVSSTFGAFALLTAVGGRSLGPLLRPVATAAIWVACEFVRAHVMGDPWALLGYTQYRVLPLLQLAPFAGVYGVSFLVALVNAGIAEALASPGGLGTRLRPLALPLTAASVCLLGGTLALHAGSGALADPLPVAVIQTNVPPAYEWDRGYAERQLHGALQLTTDALATGPRLIVWPENALSLYLDQEPLLRETLRDLARTRQVDLLIGGPRYARGHTYNSAHLVRGRDGEVQIYDKQRLVPFAEAPPLRPAEAERDESPRSFTAGRSAGLLRGRAALGVSICHEILYPDVIHPAVAAGAALLVNIANDGWLDGGYGVAGRQHFAMAVFRAVEARRFLIRAATTGISGVIDPWGRIVAASEPGTARIISAAVESRSGTTMYVRYGDWFALVCLLFAGGLAFACVVPIRQRPPVGVPAASAS